MRNAEKTRSDLGLATPSNRDLRQWVSALPAVDEVGAAARAAMLGTRSIKTSSKAAALDMAISMVDLTTLEGADTPGVVRALCAKAVQPVPDDPSCPKAAAVCVYGDRVEHAVANLQQLPGGQDVAVAAVATAFPSGRASLAVKLADTAEAVTAGADEIDMVIDRGAFLSGDMLTVFEQIAAIREVCQQRQAPKGRAAGPAHLKVILETGELGSLDNVRRASWLAMAAGADVIKTSTGKIPSAASLPVTLVMLQAVRDFRKLTGEFVGVKPAGGIRTAKDALKYLVLVNETAGADWLNPQAFRFGASTLLNDLLMQRRKLSTGVYASADRLTLAT